MSNIVFRVSRRGEDIRTANVKDLLFNGNRNTLKSATTVRGSVTIPLAMGQAGVYEGTAHIEVNNPFPYEPRVLGGFRVSGMPKVSSNFVSPIPGEIYEIVYS